MFMPTGWRKSTHSGGGNDCVEYRQPAARTAEVRDTKDRAGGSITFSGRSWHGLSTALRAE